MDFLFLLLTLVFLGVILIFFIRKRKKTIKLVARAFDEEEKKPKMKAKFQSIKKVSLVKGNPDHKLFKNAIKGFHEDIVDFDIKSGYIGVACKDGLVKIFKIKSFNDQNFKFIQGKLEREEPTAVAINLRGDLLVTSGSFDRRIHIFSMKSEKDKKILMEISTFPQKHTYQIANLACLPSCIISSGDDMDTSVTIWSYSGDILAAYDMKQLKNKHMAISSDYRFFSVAT